MRSLSMEPLEIREMFSVDSGICPAPPSTEVLADTIFQDQTYLVFDSTAGKELWRTRDALECPEKVHDLPVEAITPLFHVDSRIYFGSTKHIERIDPFSPWGEMEWLETSYEVWSTDGTKEGLRREAKVFGHGRWIVEPDWVSSSAGQMLVMNGTVHFYVNVREDNTDRAPYSILASNASGTFQTMAHSRILGMQHANGELYLERYRTDFFGADDHHWLARIDPTTGEEHVVWEERPEIRPGIVQHYEEAPKFKPSQSSVSRSWDEDAIADVFCLSGSLPGDTNNDQQVNFEDFLVLSANFGQHTDATFAAGDFDNDGVVGFADFLILANNFVTNA